MTRAGEQREQRLYVSWRAPEGSIHPIGLLIRRCDGDGEQFVFSYLKLAEQLHGFRPLPGLPDLYERYESPALFPVFANRVMPRSRPDFDQLAQRVDLSGDTDPFEVMARSGGLRQTDRVEVFSPPVHTHDDRSSCLFFARGIRHLPGAAAVVDELAAGDELVLAADPENQFNPRALLLLVVDGRAAGYVPDYLVEHIHELTHLNRAEPLITVEHVNDAATAPHLRLLCRLDAPWPTGYEAFSDARFRPLAPID
jgi:hypothetical protein